MGTIYAIKYSETPLLTNQLHQDITLIFNNINKEMSTYDTTSEISIFNNMPANLLYQISPDFYYVLEKSNYYYNLSNGLFDITIEELSSIWGFNNESFARPKDDEIKKTLEIIGFDKIQLLGNNSISKINNKVKISLNAIAKSYALDKISNYFDANNIKDYMIEIGGEVRTKGRNSDGQKWIIGLSSFELNIGNIIESISIEDGSIATSGDYRNFIIYNDIAYSHIINPLTGYPTTNSVVSSTVIADNCIDADALATLLNVMDIEKSIELINGLDQVECLIIERDGKGFNYYYSENMEKYIN